MKLAQATSQTGTIAGPGSADMLPIAPDAVHSSASSGQQALEWLMLGGPIVWVLMGLATIALAIVLLKLWQFTTAKVGGSSPAARVLADWSGGDPRPTIARLAQYRDPASRFARVALSALADHHDENTIREEIQRLANAELERLRLLLRPLAFIGSTSPLLGLLGTVIGMIGAFQGIQQAGSQVDPAALSGGIWAALLTTAVGLAVAIPVTMAHTYLERRIERLAQCIEDAVTLVFTRGLKSPPAVRRSDVDRLPSARRLGVVADDGERNAAAS